MSRATIRVLRPDVVAKIAAGEVVERPASVVKELVENSIDAGATRIGVDLEDGGAALVRVRDDGRGMTPEDLALAFVQHATSKLLELEDLDAIASLGFRGEALASIGAVARTRILSRPSDAEAGAEVRSEGGRLSEVKPAAMAPGTIVEVRDLFWNVPARRRFLRTAPAERARCLEILTRLALAHAEVGFELGGPRGFLLRPNEPTRERVAALFGRQVAEQCLDVAFERSGYRVSGLVVDPDGARRDRSLELLFVNGRPIKDRSLAHAIEAAFADYLMGGRWPVTFLFLYCDPARVDVNVHPTKTEVRFAEARLVYTVVRSAVAQALAGRAKRVVPRGTAELEAEAESPRPVSGFPELPRGLFGGKGPGPLAPPASSPGGAIAGAGVVAETPAAPRSAPARFVVAHDLYVVVPTDDGIAIVDQHALHERILYERMLAAWRQGGVPVQRLLVPAIVELAPAHKELLLAEAEALGRAGLLIEDFGGSAVKVIGYPAVLRHVDARALLEGLLGELEATGGIVEPEAIRERFHSAACRAAVKAGDRLSDAEIAALLADAESCEHPDNCPHGRPTTLTLTREQLDRYFKRRL